MKSSANERLSLLRANSREEEEEKIMPSKMATLLRWPTHSARTNCMTLRKTLFGEKYVTRKERRRQNKPKSQIIQSPSLVLFYFIPQSIILYCNEVGHRLSVDVNMQ